MIDLNERGLHMNKIIANVRMSWKKGHFIAF